MMLNQTSHSVRHSRISASLVAVICFLRGLPVFFRETPKTPLRVLCMIAFNTLHVLRTSKPVPPDRLNVLATLLDFAACANAVLDQKGYCQKEYQATRQQLENAGISSSVEEYLRQLRELERRRPATGGDHRRFDEVRSYRESVARLSLGFGAAIALGHACVEDGIRATHCDNDLETLFRIVMQCQIIDDVLDYEEDAFAGLPGFLTASASPVEATELTAQAARDYSTRGDLPPTASGFPFRMALCVVSVIAKLVIQLGHWSHRMHWAHRLPT